GAAEEASVDAADATEDGSDPDENGRAGGEAVTQRVLPIALTAAGTIWLLNAVGFVPPSLAAALGRRWPLLLIGGGLDLLVPRYRPRNVPFVALAAGAIVVLALFWPAGASRGDAEVHRELSPQTRRVTFDLDLGAHATHVAPAAS